MAARDDPEDPFAGLPGDVGDNREKFVRVTLESGEEVEHSEAYYRYTAEEFFVAPTMEFEEVTRYHKDDTARVEVLQHHSRCFITTATAGDPAVRHRLERFRDDVLARSVAGRSLVHLYYAVSPPIARTLTRAPHSKTFGVVRWLVHRCAALLGRRERAGPLARTSLTLLVVVLYLVGLVAAAAGTLAIRARALPN